MQQFQKATKGLITFLINMHVFHIKFIFRQSLRLVETSEAFIQNLVPFAEVSVTSAFYFDLAVGGYFARSEVLLSFALDTQYIEFSILGAATALKLSQADMK
jgi:hypothetical protein